MPYDEELLSGLTDEERAALEESDGGTSVTMGESLDKNGDTDVDQGAGTGEEGEEGDEDTGTADDDAAGAGAAGNGDDAGAGTDADAAGTADVAGDQPAPLLVAEMPERAAERLQEFKAQKAELATKFDDGEITTKEYHEQLEAINEQQGELQAQIAKAETAAELNKQQEVNSWHKQIRDFTGKTHPEYLQSKVRWMALDAFVKEVGSDPANQHLTGPQILAKAHELVEKDLGVAPKQGKAKADPAPTEKQKLELTAANRPLKGSKPAAPKTLRDVPAAAANEVDDGKYAALDRLRERDPEAHESRLMKMSESERDAYLAHG